MATAPSEIDALKARLKGTWMAGDFGRIARSYAPGAREFIARLALPAGSTVLDVACGTGNLAIPAAQAGAIVTGADIASNLLEQARARADAESVMVQFDEADAEQLPYVDGTFDTVVSMFGVMFAPRPELAAAELVRVCRRGGKIALANWTPTGFIGHMFKTTAGHVPPAAGVPSPIQWGEPARIRERFGDRVSSLELIPRMITFTFPFAGAELVEHWRLYYGPTHRAFEALKADPEKQAALRRDLEHLWTPNNRSTSGTTQVESEYLEVIATRV
jgi:SAM-dependent methyltransferase